MSTKKPAHSKRPTLSAAFDDSLSSHLLGLRGEVDRRSSAKTKTTEHLAAVEATIAALQAALEKVARSRSGDVGQRLEELEYPVTKLRAFFGHKKTALDKRATEIMAEYVRDRLLEIRIIAKTLDAS